MIRGTRAPTSYWGSKLPHTPSLEDLLNGDLEVPTGTHSEYVVSASGPVLVSASTMRYSSSVVGKIRQLRAGEGYISYRRLGRDIAPTLVADHRALPVHPRLTRTISVREAARIQGFSGDYVFCGPRAHQPLQVANAVPPPVAGSIDRHLRKVIRVRNAIGTSGGVLP